MKLYLKETLIETTEIVTGKWIKLVHDRVRLPDGQEASREYVRHSGAVAVVALTSSKQIVLEYQYRHPVKEVMLELPAGKLEQGEDMLVAAKRELSEETGYTSESWLKLGTCLPCIGYSDERITYFLALDVVPGIVHLDQGEFVETTTMDIDKCLKLGFSGMLSDSKTLAGLMLYHGYREGYLLPQE